ncbi:phage tail sheath C-terminal domain-containing protein [Rubritalea spongiae]|uniref:Phage tail sheath C-terminal domain-containing protein n=1 Tax=Rubritalea spongiae TaxID=430797 RepID=A0ABW5E3G1_9BACT
MMNANNPMTPGVYTVEKSAFPPAVAEVPTAIPAFIGYTEFATKNGKPLTEPLLIQSMAEYNQHFGGPPPFQYPITKLDSPTPGVAPAGYDFEINDNYYKVGTASPGNAFYLYHCLQLFYQNGGGPCYITSVGTYFSTVPSLTGGAPTVTPTEPEKEDFLAGLELLPRIQDPKPTMILTPDSLLLGQSDYYTVQEQVLMQCGELKDRVAIIDIYDGFETNADAGVIDNFRNMIGNNNMSYGISYYPFLDTTIVDANQVTYANVDQSKGNPDATPLSDIFPGAQPLNNLASMTEDLSNVEQLTIPAPYNFGNTTPPTSVPAKAASGVVSYPSWTVAFSAATPPTPTDFATNLRWQLNVIYSMAFTLTQLGANKQLPYPAVSITSADLINGINAMMKPTGYLMGLFCTLGAYDANFTLSDGKKGLGIITNNTLTKLCSATTPASQPPQIGTTNPYPSSATTAAAQYSIINAQIQKVYTAMSNAISQVTTLANTLLSQYNASFENQNADYKNLMAGIAKEASLLPPGPALAGVMTMVDDSQGVWVSPANININSVNQPSVSINNDEQASLNVDVIAGKSINAIRAFTGRGPAIIWGARTLDGNSLDWRYVSIRRTMIMIEQSVANAAFQFVFALNNASTWKTVEGMIANFLHNLWSAGCLQGASPEDAYSVSVGLGSTMTPIDILEGIMRVEVKVAVVHPAEFIIITYEQEMAKS